MPGQAAVWMTCRLLCCGNTNSISVVEWEAREQRRDAKSEGNDGRQQNNHCAYPETPADDKTDKQTDECGKNNQFLGSVIRFSDGKTIQQ